MDRPGSSPSDGPQASSSKSALDRPASPPHNDSAADISLRAVEVPAFQIAASPAPGMPAFPRRDLDTVLAAAVSSGAAAQHGQPPQTLAGRHKQHTLPATPEGNIESSSPRSSTETLSDADDGASIGGVSFDDETPSSPQLEDARSPSATAQTASKDTLTAHTANDFDELELAAATIDQLQAALLQSNKRCEQLAAAFAAQESAADATSRKLVRASAKNKELSGAIKTLRSRLRDSKALTDALRAKQEGGQAQGARTEAALAEMQRRVEAERTAAEDAQQAMQNIRAQMHDRAQQLGQAQAQLASAAEEKSLAEAAAADATSQLAEVQTQLAASQTQHQDTKSQLGDALQQADALRDTVSKQEAALTEAAAQCSGLKEQLAVTAASAAAAEAAVQAEQAQHACTQRALRAAENCAMSAEDAAATWHERTERLMRAYSAAAVASEHVQEELHAVVRAREATIAKLRKQVQRMPQLAEAAANAKRREAVTSGKLMQASASAQGWYDEAQKAKAAAEKAESRGRSLQARLTEHADDEACLKRNANSALAEVAAREQAAVAHASELESKLRALQGTHRNTVDGVRSLRVQVQQLQEELVGAQTDVEVAEKRNVALQSALTGMRHASSRAVAAAGVIAQSASSPAGRGAWGSEHIPPGTSPTDVLRLLAAMTSELEGVSRSQRGGGNWDGGGVSGPMSPVALFQSARPGSPADRSSTPGTDSPHKSAR